MYKTCLISLALVVSVASLVETKDILIDQDELADVESIAQVVCEVKKGTSKQIGNGSTIAKLAKFFRDLPVDHKLANCGTKYALSIERFDKILSINNDNVCSEAKLLAVEEFHQDYVSRLSKHVENRKSGQLNIPKVVKLFFLHYVTEVSSTCARDAMRQMETLKWNSGEDRTDLPKIDASLSRFQDYMGTSKLNHGYNEVFLPWLLVEGLPLEKYSNYIEPHGDKRLNIKIKDSQKFLNIQSMCSHLLRPIYGRVLLPVIRLISLGYYPTSQDLAQQLAQESPFKRLYVAAQLCETILPIQVFSDGSLDAEEIVMITAEDSLSLKPESIPSSEPFEGAQFGLTPPNNSMESEFVLDKDRAFNSIDDLKANVVARGKALAKILKLVSKTVTKSKLKKIFIMKRGNKREPVHLDHFEEIDETFVYQPEDEVRVRRETRLFTRLIDTVFNVMLIIVLIPFLIAHFLFAASIIVLYKLFRYITGYAIGYVETVLERIWDFPNKNELDLTWDPCESSRKVRYVGPRKRIVDFQQPTYTRRCVL